MNEVVRLGADIIRSAKSSDRTELERRLIDFKGSHFPKDVILHALFFYVRYAVSYRDPNEILVERGVSVPRAGDRHEWLAGQGGDQDQTAFERFTALAE